MPARVPKSPRGAPRFRNQNFKGRTMYGILPIFLIRPDSVWHRAFLSSPLHRGHTSAEQGHSGVSPPFLSPPFGEKRGRERLDKWPCHNENCRAFIVCSYIYIAADRKEGRWIHSGKQRGNESREGFCHVSIAPPFSLSAVSPLWVCAVPIYPSPHSPCFSDCPFSSSCGIHSQDNQKNE